VLPPALTVMIVEARWAGYRPNGPRDGSASGVLTGMSLLPHITVTKRTDRFHGALHLIENPPGGRRDIRANGRRMAQAKLSDTTPLHNLQARCQT